MRTIIGVGTLFFLFATSSVIADQRSVMSEIVKNVSDVCHSPDNTSKYWLLDVKGEGEAGLKLKLGKAGVSGEANFTKEEWEGVQRVLREHQITDNQTYRDCVTELTPIFIERFVPISAVGKKQASLESSKKATPVKHSTSWNGLVFDIREAKMEGSELLVKFRITSPGKDRVIKMKNGGDAFVVIDGDEYRHSHLQIGQSKGRKLYSGVTIPGDIGMNSEVRFKSVPAVTAKIDLLRLLFWKENVSFKNVVVN